MTLEKVLRNLESAALESLNRTIGAAAAATQRRAPRLTGGLAETVTVEGAKSQGPILSARMSYGNEEHPAGPVEFGTSHQTPEPAFRPSVSEAEEFGVADMVRSIRQALPRS